MGALFMIAAGAAGMVLIAQTEATSTEVAVLWAGFGAIPIVMGIVQAMKQVGLPSRWAGVVSLVLGVAGGVIFAGSLDLWRTAVAGGLYVGLSASGLYSTLKASTAPEG